ncbi:hypothetical protein [Hydrogenimonas sp.]
MEEKKRQKYLQMRYKRELERFLNRLVNLCRGEGSDKAAFDAAVARGLKRLDEVEKVPLYGDYFERLERFVETAGRLARSDVGAEEAKETILKEANLMRKSRRIKRYNRKDRRERPEDF